MEVSLASHNGCEDAVKACWEVLDSWRVECEAAICEAKEDADDEMTEEDANKKEEGEGSDSAGAV